jgi:hypothetical protein
MTYTSVMNGTTRRKTRLKVRDRSWAVEVVVKGTEF